MAAEVSLLAYFNPRLTISWNTARSYCEERLDFLPADHRSERRFPVLRYSIADVKLLIFWRKTSRLD